MIMEAGATVPLLLARDNSHASQRADSSADFCTIMNVEDMDRNDCACKYLDKN